MQEICNAPLFDAAAAERAISQSLCTASSVELTLLKASLRFHGAISADEIVRRTVKSAAVQELLLFMLQASGHMAVRWRCHHGYTTVPLVQELPLLMLQASGDARP